MQFRDRSLRTRGVVAALVVAVGLQLTPLAAHASEATNVGLGAASALSNVVYGPAKLILATIGTITAGLGYAVTAGDTDVARTIFFSSVKGDYVIVPDHLTGKRPLEFIGRAQPAPADDWGTPPSENAGF
jgi:type IV secretory pathway VirB2 component (pilin)